MRVFYLFYENKKSELSTNQKYTIGRSKENDIVLQDTRVSRHHATLIGQGDSFLLVDENSTNGSWIEGKAVRETILREGSQFRLGNCNCEIQVKETHLDQVTPIPSDTMIFEGHISEILHEVNDTHLADKISQLKNFYNHKKEALADLAFRDTLTGLYNRRFFDKKLDEEFKRAIRYHRPLSIIMIDIDHFKNFNDTYGHQKGDEVLAGVATILNETSRNLDILCRYGGEEMVFILPETPGEDALKMAGHCCRRVEENSKEIADVTVTISLGVANITPWDKGPEILLSRADEALYEAKEGGRNQSKWNR